MRNSFKNKIISFIYFFCRKINKRTNNFNSRAPDILVVSTTALGDSLWAIPSLRAIKKRYKNADVSVLCTEKNKEIFDSCPYVDRVFSIKDKSFLSVLRAFLKLKKEKIQTVCILHCSQRFVFFMLSLLFAEHLIGTEGKNKNLDFLLTHRVEDKFTHEIKRRLELLKILDIHSKDYTLDFFFHPTFQKSNDLNHKQKTVILHPGAKDPFRCWHKNYYVELANLLQKASIQVIITGADHEKKLVHYIYEKAPQVKIDVGFSSLNDFAHAIKKADLLVTNDTGPLHLAIALKTKTLSLFTPTDPNLFGPLEAKGAFVIKKTPTCKICRKRSCPFPSCFSTTTPDEVFEKCLEILKK